MKILIERKYKKEAYTIGRLYLEGKFICHTMEPRDRGLTQKMSTSEILYKKVWGQTAIPAGTYRVKMAPSIKFKARRPFLIDVKGFTGVMIHEGNYPKNTQGCILVGRNTKVGMVLDSRLCLGEITEAVVKAEERNEPVVITVR